MADKSSPTGGKKGKVHETRVEAMVRVRPFNRRELERLRAEDENGMPQSIVMMKGRRVSLLDPAKGYQECEAFDFDEAFWSIPEEQWAIDMQDEIVRKAIKEMGVHCVEQEEVYDKTGALAVQHAFDGFHSCIFAYGQTGAGKTYSMLGGLDSAGGLDQKVRSQRGICPRLVEGIFEKIEFLKGKGDNTVFSVELSFMEIYKEKCKDLLIAPKKKEKKKKGGPIDNSDQEKEYADLKVRHSPSDGTYVEGLNREVVTSAEQCCKLMAYGMEARHTAATKMNDVSSRSHAIFQITFKQKNPIQGMNTLSNINLVDLAGSERIKMSGAEGARLDEATKINLSLSTLRRVIDVLIEKAKKKNSKVLPPYRESMLTWLLSESLGGNSKTIMLAAVSPYHGNFEDTANTLRYANKAKDIVCKAKRNDERGAVVVMAMRMEMERLREKLAEKADAADEEVRIGLKQQLEKAEADYAKAKGEFDELQEQGRILKEKHDALQSEIKARDEAAQDLRRIKAETTELREKRAKLEEEASAVGAEAEHLSRKLKHTEIEIEETRKEKEQLREEEKILLQKEEHTRLEMQQTKQRQLALAFRNSLQIHKDRKFMDTLASQQTTAKEKFAKIEGQLELKKIELSKVQDENRYLTTTFEQAQQRLADLNRNYADSMALLNEKIHRLSAAKKKAEQDKVHYQSDISKTEEALSKIKEEKERENQESNAKLGELDKEYHQIVRENEEADQKISAAQQEVVRAKAQLAALREEHKRLAEQNGVTSKDLADVEAEHKELLSVNRSLLTKVAEAKDQLAATDRQKSDVQLQIEDMSSEIKKITRNHADLKQFVSSRFFPAGQVPSALNDPPPPAQRAREHTGRFPQPKQTLKSQQIHKKMKEQKAARLATASGSATARSTSQQHTSPRATSTATPSKKYSDPMRNGVGHAPMTQRRVRSPVSRTRSPPTK
eukprot:TRINITY_DN1234_c3_g1_i1.p1 TRINITY_DN1234_c3_g1~~TRINITY_DN1234_c3_g1_i1.p1  ORF type:complete len:964 (+),score=275.37 TRINITY_DN1234_c3_g1_i1:42-2894(+)